MSSSVDSTLPEGLAWDHERRETDDASRVFGRCARLRNELCNQWSANAGAVFRVGCYHGLSESERSRSLATRRV